MRHEELMAQQEETDAAFEQADQTLAEVQQKTLDAKVALEEAEHASSTLMEKARSLESQIELMCVQLQTNQERVRDAKERQSGADEEIENLTAHMEELAARRESLDETAQREGLSRVLEELNGKNEAHKAAEAECARAEEELEAARTRNADLNAAQTRCCRKSRTSRCAEKAGLRKARSLPSTWMQLRPIVRRWRYRCRKRGCARPRSRAAFRV